MIKSYCERGQRVYVGIRYPTPLPPSIDHSIDNDFVQCALIISAEREAMWAYVKDVVGRIKAGEQ